MGQHMENIGNTTRKSASGYESHLSLYRAKNCSGCPLRCLCHTAKGNRQIEVNHNLKRHKEIARERLTSEEGLMHRSQRPVEPESVFGQSKSNKGYNRFRHFDDKKPEKVMMDFAIFAIAFNVLKLHRKGKNTGINPSQRQKSGTVLCFFILVRPKTDKTDKIKTFIFQVR